jgi:hypothetical protein
MVRNVSLDSVTNLGIRLADLISAVDRRNPAFCIQLWGQEPTPSIRPPGSPAHQPQTLRVEIDSKDDKELQKLLGMLEAAKGRLPKDVQHLKGG